MNKKTLIIIYWNLGIGGIQKRIRDLVKEIVTNRSGWRVVILIRKTSKEGFQGQINHTKGVTIETYPFNNQRIRPIGGFFFWLLFKYVKLKPTVCLTFLPMLGVALCIIRRIIFWTKTKLVLNEGVLLTDYLRIHNLEWLRPFVSVTYNLADSIIVPTQACREDLLSSFSVDAPRVCVLPNWTLLKKHTPRLRQQYDLVYVGRFDAEKNVLSICDMVEKIARHHPKLRVIMIGSGELLSDLQSRIKLLKIENHVQIKKFTVHASRFIYESKILLLPSINEGMPNVVLEAAMMGIPTVAADFKGSHEVILHKKTGYIATTMDKMCRYIHRLLTDDVHRHAMGKNAQGYIQSGFTKKAQQNFITAILS